jgi:hypothetical protein
MSSVGEPGGDQGNKLDGPLGAGAVVGVGLVGLALLAFGEALAVAIGPQGNGQGEDLGRGPEGVDDEQTEDDPIMSPTDQGFGAAADEGVVVHAGAIERKAAFATEGVINRPLQGAAEGEDADHPLGQAQRQAIQVPGGVTEEAMETTPVAVVEVAPGKDDFGDVAMAVGQQPAGDDLDKGLKGGCGSTGRKSCSSRTNEGVSSIGRLPCDGAIWDREDPKVSKTEQGSRLFISYRPNAK